VTPLDIDALEQLRGAGAVRLIAGHHDIADTGKGCAMDLIAWQTTGETTDMPSCVHPLLARTVHRLNDDTDDEADRWRLVLDAGPHLVGSDAWPAERVLWVLAHGRRSVTDLIDALDASRNAAPWILFGADLRDANLRDANLRGANLPDANLTGANLRDANLTGADLRDADLRGANLRGADLTGANLRGANLRGANLFGADLRGANLRGANLRGANLPDANLTGGWWSDSPPPRGWTVTNGRLTRP
jgi:hypothetical protein